MNKQIVQSSYDRILLHNAKKKNYRYMKHHGWISKTLFWVKDTRVHSIWFHLSKVQAQSHLSTQIETRRIITYG